MTAVFRLAPRTLLRTLLALSAVTTLIVAFQQQHRASEKLKDPRGGHISDFDRWMIMTPRFLHDRVDYVNDDLPTPPITLIAFAPLAALSRPNAEFAWVCAKLPLVYLVFALAAGMVKTTGTELTTPAILLIVSGWWLAVIVDLQQGQTNFLALLPLVAGLYLAQRDSLPAGIAAGALVGLGVAVKLTPLAFVAYFAWRRRWTVAGAAAASLTLWWLVVPALAFGWEQNLKWFEQWARIMIVPYVARGEVMYSTTQSVGSFLLRLLSHAPAFDSHYGGVTEPHFMDVLSLSHAAVYQIVRGLMVAVALGGLWWMRHPLATLKSPRYVVEIAAVSAFMLWFSERTWVHHYVTFVLMLVAAGMVVSDPAQPERSQRLVFRAALMFFVFTLFASEAGKAFGRNGIDWAHAYGVYLVPSVVMTVAVLRAAAAREATRTIGAFS